MPQLGAIDPARPTNAMRTAAHAARAAHATHA